MKLLVLVTNDYTNWEKFQSLLDSMQELYEVEWIVTCPPIHKLVALYCKIDLILCSTNSMVEYDKYDVAIVIGTSKYSVEKQFFTLLGLQKPVVANYEREDEFEWSTRANRRHNTERYLNRQRRLAKHYYSSITISGKNRKRHFLDCGNPKCSICTSVKRQLTLQEIKINESTKEYLKASEV